MLKIKLYQTQILTSKIPNRDELVTSNHLQNRWIFSHFLLIMSKNKMISAWGMIILLLLCNVSYVLTRQQLKCSDQSYVNVFIPEEFGLGIAERKNNRLFKSYSSVKATVKPQNFCYYKFKRFDIAPLAINIAL